MNMRKAAPESLIDRLVNRLGSRAVRRMFPRASHIPELAQSARSALTRSFSARSASSRNDFATSWIGQIPRKPPRPPLLLARPEPLSVLAEIPEGPPGRFTWRHVTARVIKAEGPERIAPEWWRSLVRHERSATITSILAGRSNDLRSVEGVNYKTSLSFTPLRGEGVSGTSSAGPRDYYRIEDDGRRTAFREGSIKRAKTGRLGSCTGYLDDGPVPTSRCASPRGARQHHAAINSATPATTERPRAPYRHRSLRSNHEAAAASDQCDLASQDQV